MPHRPADDAPEYVAAFFIGGEHAVIDQECRGARVVSDYLQRHVGLTGGSVSHPCRIRHLIDESPEVVRLEIVSHALQDRRQPLEPEASVYVLARQRLQLAALVAVVLHEDEVPQLQVAVAVAAGPAIRAAAEFGPLVQ